MTIFEFIDYKKFLKSEIKKRPKHGRGEISRLAEFLNVNSTMVSQIITGEKNFTIEQAKKVAEFFILPKLETDYFLILVQIERAGTFDLKNYFREKRDEIKKESLKISKRVSNDKPLSDLERSVFYSSWVYSAVHLFCSVDEGQTLEQIIVRFDLSRLRAQEVLQFLLSSGLVINENGKYKMASKSTHVEKGSPFLIKHHANWRVTALQKSEDLAESELMYTGNISLSKSDFSKIREQLVATIQDVIKTVKASPAEDVANLSIDLFWMP